MVEWSSLFIRLALVISIVVVIGVAVVTLVRSFARRNANFLPSVSR